MKRYRTFVIAVGLMVLINGCTTAEKTDGGASAGSASPAPQSTAETTAAEFVLTTTEGESISLSAYRGKVVILDFWATWCPPCRMEIPHFNELAKEYGDKGLVVLGVSVDKAGVEVVRQFEREFPVMYPVVMGDPRTYEQYQSYLPPAQRGGIPFTFVIDRQGKIRERYVGYRDKATFEAALKRLL